jgi:hypothetical protein
MSPSVVSRPAADDLSDRHKWFLRNILEFEKARRTDGTHELHPWGRSGSGGGLSNVPLSARYEVHILDGFESVDEHGRVQTTVDVTPAKIYDTIVGLLDGPVVNGFPLPVIDVIREAWDAEDLSMLTPTHRDLIMQATCNITEFYDRRGQAANIGGVTARPESVRGGVSFHDEFPHVSVRRGDVEITRIPFDRYGSDVALETSRDARQALLKGIAAGWALHAAEMRSLLSID